MANDAIDLANVLRRLRWDLDNLQGAVRRGYGRQAALEEAMIKARLVTQEQLDQAEKEPPSS